MQCILDILFSQLMPAQFLSDISMANDFSQWITQLNCIGNNHKPLSRQLSRRFPSGLQIFVALPFPLFLTQSLFCLAHSRLGPTLSYMKLTNFKQDLSSTPWIQSDLLFHKQHKLVFILNTLFGGSLLVKQTLNCRDSTDSMQTWSWSRRVQPEQGSHQRQPAWQQETPCFPSNSPQQENAPIHPLY